MGPVDVMIEEYKALRAESLDSLKSMNSIVGFGVIGFGTIFGLAAQPQIGRGPDNTNIFFVVIPVYALFLLIYWLGELLRAQRSGAFTGVISDRINAAIGHRALIWEDFLQQKFPANGMKLSYVMAAAIFILMSMSGIYYGILLLSGRVPSNPIALSIAIVWSVRNSFVAGLGVTTLLLSIVYTTFQFYSILSFRMNLHRVKAHYPSI